MLGVMCYIILLFVVTGQHNEIHSDIMQATYNILLIAVVRLYLARKSDARDNFFAVAGI